MKKSKYFSKSWWTDRLAMIIRDEENFAEKTKISYTPAQVASIAFLSFLIIFGLGFILAWRIFSGHTPIGRDAEMRAEMVRINIVIDSLGNALQKRESYTTDLRKTIGGEFDRQKITAPIDTTKKKGGKPNQKDSVNIDKLSEADLKLREEMETRPANFTNNTSIADKNNSNMYLFSPVKGIISNKYDVKTKHLGIDIVADKDAPIKSIHDGTVVMASWTDETGYVITVQHQSDLLSVYKHCSVLLKKTGDFVRAGEIVGIIGNSGELTTGPHLHFEIWYKGNPTNPEEMIAF